MTGRCVICRSVRDAALMFEGPEGELTCSTSCHNKLLSSYRPAHRREA